MTAAPSQARRQRKHPRQEEGGEGKGGGVLVGGGEERGEEVPGLGAPRFMATACRITNTGNLKSPPVTSFLLFHSSSLMSNTITLLSGLSLFSSLFYSSSLIHYPLTAYLLWQTQGGGKFFVIERFPGSKAELGSITPLQPVQTRSPSHTPLHNSAASTAMCRISKRSQGGSEDKHRPLCASVFVFLIEPSSRRSCGPLWSPTTALLYPELQRPRL